MDSERDGHRVAFNRAFEEMGLPDRWDPDLYGRLLAIAGGARRIDTHLAGRGMPEDERSRIVPRLHERKTEIFIELVREGRVPPRPGALRLIRELGEEGVRLAVATTGTRAWVEPLLARCFAEARFEVVVTGDEAPVRKPDPSAHRLALEGLGADAAGTAAIEDSDNGLAAAHAAGLPCAVVVNGYTAGHDLSAAELVLDGFGEPSSPARVLRDPAGAAPDGILDAAALAHLAGARPGRASGGVYTGRLTEEEDDGRG